VGVFVLGLLWPCPVCRLLSCLSSCCGWLLCVLVRAGWGPVLFVVCCWCCLSAAVVAAVRAVCCWALLWACLVCRLLPVVCLSLAELCLLLLWPDSAVRLRASLCMAVPWSPGCRVGAAARWTWATWMTKLRALLASTACFVLGVLVQGRVSPGLLGASCAGGAPPSWSRPARLGKAAHFWVADGSGRASLELEPLTLQVVLSRAGSR
jgi:hypothetical protein